MKENLPKEQCGMLKILYLLCFVFSVLFFPLCFLDIECCFLCWLLLLLIVSFFFLFVQRKVVIKNSERHAEHISLWTYCRTGLSFC